VEKGRNNLDKNLHCSTPYETERDRRVAEATRQRGTWITEKKEQKNRRERERKNKMGY